MYTTESVQSYRRAVIRCDACHLEMREEGGGYHDFTASSVDEKRKLSNERAKALAKKKWNTRACEVLEGDGTGEALPEIRTCVVVKEHVDIDGERMTDYSCGCCNQSGWNHNYCPNCGAKVVER